MHELGEPSTIFTSEALAPYDARVHEIAVREELGRLSEFRVRFSVETAALPDEDLDALLERPCSIRLGASEDDVIHGVVSASNRVRMGQSYAGAGYGSHFPLHQGTEVLLAFVDGDPDRPMIVGAVANAQTSSASRNATQSVIRSASGIQFSMEDFHAPPPSSRIPH